MVGAKGDPSSSWNINTVSSLQCLVEEYSLKLSVTVHRPRTGNKWSSASFVL